MKKLLTLILACTMILSCPVSASAASAKYTKATKAYESWMKKNCSKPYFYAYYDIVDIDQNGIPELLLSNQYTQNRLYTYDYSKKKMVLLAKSDLGRNFPNEKIMMYNTKKKTVEIVFWDTQKTVRKFYQVKGTKLKTIKTYEWGGTCRINGKKCSDSAYHKNLDKDLKSYKGMRYYKRY